MIGASLDLVRKAGAVVLTALAPFSDISPPLYRWPCLLYFKSVC